MLVAPIRSCTSRDAVAAMLVCPAATTGYLASRAGANMISPRSKTVGSGRTGSGPPVMFPLALPRCTPDATSTAARRLDCSDVDLFHLHHRIERALGGSNIRIGNRSREGGRRNLPGQSPFILAPAARTLFAVVTNDRVPVAISFGLVSGCNLKR